jgi:hypothetical protein
MPGIGFHNGHERTPEARERFILLEQILKLWAAEFGSRELTAKELIASASAPLLGMFLRVAPT